MLCSFYAIFTPLWQHTVITDFCPENSHSLKSHGRQASISCSHFDGSISVLWGPLCTLQPLGTSPGWQPYRDSRHTAVQGYLNTLDWTITSPNAKGSSYMELRL